MAHKNVKILKPFPLTSLLLLCLSLQAQTPVFRQHSTKDLGTVRLSTVMQDSRGWLWCGSEGGEIYRYDGLAFQPVGKPESTEQSSVTALFEQRGRLWVGYQSGAIASVPVAANFQFPLAALASPARHGEVAAAAAPQLVLWQPEEGLPKKDITAFATDPSGSLWIGTYGEGLYVWKNGRLYQFNQTDDGLASDDVYALATDNQGRVWAATDAGISICSMTAPGQKQVKNLSIADGLPDEIVTTLLTDPQGNIWVGTHDRGLGCYEAATMRCIFWQKNWTHGPVTSLAAFGSREVWVGTEKHGLLRLDRASGAAHPLPEGHPMRHSTARHLCKDREGLLWAVLDRGGLCSSNVRYSTLDVPFGSVQAVLSDRLGRLWVGTQQGLFCIPQLPVPIFREGFGVLSKNVIALWESPSDGNIWVGTFGNGAYLVSPQGRTLRHLTERDGLPNGSILSIAGDGQRVWLATLGGVASCGPDGRVLQGDDLAPYPSALPAKGRSEGHAPHSSYVYKILCDSRGRTWFGTDGKGLAVLDGGVLRYFTEANGIAVSTVYSIAEDRRGRIWFSTEAEGLFCYDGTGFQRFTPENHLHSLSMTGLAADGNGNIVIGYEDGFDVLNPDREEHFSFCDAASGAPAAEVNLNALCRDAQGDVWLGTQQGVVRATAFDEVFLDDPQPGITSVSVFMQAVDFQQQTTFAHDQNYFVFNFTGLWYTQPESVRYRYRLEGFDPDWKVSKDHLASYPKLPPGHYTLRVQTSEHGNFERVPEVSWSFVVQPPFWSEWWFVLLCAAGFGGLLWAFVRNREERLRREAQLKRESVESQFAALKSQINPHFLFNSFNTLITIIEETPKIAVEYVEHLSDFYRSIMAYRERDFITVQEEMDLVRSFYFLLKKRYETGLHLHNRLDAHTAGQVMPLALQMLVENAVKHNVISADKPLTVEIFSENDGYITVRNNIRRKIKPEPSTHFGLQSLIRRYQLLGERPVLVEDNVAFFTVKVPVITMNEEL